VAAALDSCMAPPEPALGLGLLALAGALLAAASGALLGVAALGAGA